MNIPGYFFRSSYHFPMGCHTVAVLLAVPLVVQCISTVHPHYSICFGE